MSQSRISCKSCLGDRFAVFGDNLLRCQSCGAVTQITPTCFRSTVSMTNQWFRRPVGPYPNYNAKGEE